MSLCIIVAALILWLFYTYYESLQNVFTSQNYLLQPAGATPFGRSWRMSPSLHRNWVKNSSSLHIVTGLMVIRTDSVVDASRASETGMWLSRASFSKIPKTIYHVDYYHKRVKQLLSERSKRKNKNKNESVWDTLVSMYFSPTLLSTSNLKIVPLTNPANAQECGYYLQYIVDQYHTLADYSIFLHGGPESHNPHIFEQLEWLLNDTDRELKEVRFLQLNCEEYVMRRSVNAGNLLALLGFDPEAFTELGSLTAGQIVSGMRYFASQCCAQFIVSSKTIQAYPLDFWKLALKLTLDNKQFCINWEYMWHAVFLGVQELPKNLTLDHFYRRAHPTFSSRCPNGLRSNKA